MAHKYKNHHSALCQNYLLCDSDVDTPLLILQMPTLRLQIKRQPSTVKKATRRGN